MVAQALGAEGERQGERRFGAEKPRAGGAFVEVFLRRFQGGEGAGAAPPGQVEVERGLGNERPMADGRFPTGHAPALDFDFGIVDEVVGLREVAAQ